jgi:hypothetical protein
MQSHDIGHPDTGRKPTRPDEEQRHMERFQVQTIPMAEQVMIAKRFAMIGSHNDQGILVQPPSFQFGK